MSDSDWRSAFDAFKNPPEFKMPEGLLEADEDCVQAEFCAGIVALDSNCRKGGNWNARCRPGERITIRLLASLASRGSPE